MCLDVVIPLIFFISIPTAGTSIIDLYFSDINNTWFRRLRKPLWIAPNYIFQNVWIFLLVSMGLASYIVWKTPEKTFLPLFLYGVLLGLIWAWTPTFFRMKSLTASLVIVAVLIPIADFCAYLFLEVNPVAGFLVAPLPLWLIYIAYLNFTLCYLNQRCMAK